jgi:hypothetical protein
MDRQAQPAFAAVRDARDGRRLLTWAALTVVEDGIPSS